ncbi:MAG: hypothetical protein K0S18_1497 [Anaerocolumna sp.]|nr:hypothetical protein [Anaerocolumna sp.]
MNNTNEMLLEIQSVSRNESFARMVVAGFVAQLDPTIENIQKAMEPLYTTRPELERSGMGFAFMEAFMDELSVDSKPGEGTTVKMQKRIHQVLR